MKKLIPLIGLTLLTSSVFAEDLKNSFSIGFATVYLDEPINFVGNNIDDLSGPDLRLKHYFDESVYGVYRGEGYKRQTSDGDTELSAFISAFGVGYAHSITELSEFSVEAAFVRATAKVCRSNICFEDDESGNQILINFSHQLKDQSLMLYAYIKNVSLDSSYTQTMFGADYSFSEKNHMFIEFGSDSDDEKYRSISYRRSY